MGIVNDRDLELLREEIRAMREESREHIRGLREDTDRMRRESGEFMRWMAMTFEQQVAAFHDLRESIADMRDQIQANTRAVLRVLDKLDEPPRAQA